MKNLTFLLLMAATVLSGCRTASIVLKDTPLSLSETRRVIVSIIGEPRSLSENGREMVSQYYDKKDQKIEKMNMARERRYTHVAVLGSRRPYDVKVEVYVEVRNQDGEFDTVDRDLQKAKFIGEKINQALNQSRDNRNVIDDFRSF